MPRNKHDLAAVNSAIAADWQVVQPVFDQILEWTQDGNWPVAQRLYPWLITLGPDIAPYLRPILLGPDACWTYFILVCLIQRSNRLAKALLPELQRMVDQPTPAEEAEGIPHEARLAIEGATASIDQE